MQDENNLRMLTVEEAGKEGRVILDLRSPEEFRSSSCPGAVSFPRSDFLKDREGATGRLDRTHSYALMDNSGNGSREICLHLMREGFDLAILSGGWRSYLAGKLGRFLLEEEETRKARLAGIERSIIKKFRKELWCPFTKAVREYHLIEEGDRIACCISGGKDSFLLAKLLQEEQRHGPVKFDLIFLVMNPGYSADNWTIIQRNAEILGIPLTVFETRIFDAVASIDKSPCYLCARMRRGYLYNNARQLGYTKIALGHHYDDVIETILMGMLYAGKVETMLPKLHSQHFEGMELIRPLYLCREKDIKAWRDYNHLSFLQCACRFTENTAEWEERRFSKRALVKELIRELAQKDPVIEANIFKSVQNINLRTVMAYHKDGERHSFLDDYEEDEDRNNADRNPTGGSSDLPQAHS